MTEKKPWIIEQNKQLALDSLNQSMLEYKQALEAEEYPCKHTYNESLATLAKKVEIVLLSVRSLV